MKCGMCQRELTVVPTVGMACLRCQEPLHACDRCVDELAARAPKGATIATWGIFMARIVQGVLERRHACAGAAA